MTHALPHSDPRAIVAETPAAAVAAAREAGQRVTPATIAGRPAWVKIALEKRLILRLQKGPAPRLLREETAMLRAMAARGLAVPEVIGAGDDWLITGDTGPTLAALLADRPLAPDLPRAFAAAGRALAQMHHAGCAHGRPHLRDVCWDAAQGRACFIDLERAASLSAGMNGFTRDLLIFVFAYFSVRPQPGPQPLLEAFGKAYRQAAPAGIWGAACQRARRWRWLGPFSRPLRWHERRFKPHRRFKEYAAIPLTLRHFDDG